MERFNIPSTENLPPNIIKAIKLRVISALKRWMQLSFDDFVESPTLMNELKNFIQKVETENASLAMQLNNTLQHATNTHDDKEKQLSFLGASKAIVDLTHVNIVKMFSLSLSSFSIQLSFTYCPSTLVHISLCFLCI